MAGIFAHDTHGSTGADPHYIVLSILKQKIISNILVNGMPFSFHKQEVFFN